MEKIRHLLTLYVFYCLVSEVCAEQLEHSASLASLDLLLLLGNDLTESVAMDSLAVLGLNEAVESLLLALGRTKRRRTTLSECRVQVRANEGRSAEIVCHFILSIVQSTENPF